MLLQMITPIPSLLWLYSKCKMSTSIRLQLYEVSYCPVLFVQIYMVCFDVPYGRVTNRCHDIDILNLC